ncbi:MAG: putative dsRNA-binding protein [Trueperaceae bacterium]
MIHPKAALIERLQREGRGQPQFVTQREGPDHEPTFRSQVKIQGRAYGDGEGGNKREAERRAAEAALTRLDRAAAKGGAATEGGAAAGGGGGGKRKRKSAAGGGPATPAANAKGAEQAADAEPAPAEEPFGGPWPVFERVLAESLRIAHERVDADLRGDVALAGVEAFALRLYKDVLEDLGEVVDEA